jgi:hypothetical protein
MKIRAATGHVYVPERKFQKEARHSFRGFSKSGRRLGTARDKNHPPHNHHRNEIRFTNSTKTFLEERNSARHNRLSALRLA